MPYVIEARKREKNRIIHRYFFVNGVGESVWVRKRFEAKAYKSRKIAERARIFLGEATYAQLRGNRRNWQISIRSLSHQITDDEMRELANECIESLVKRTGLARRTIVKRLREKI